MEKKTKKKNPARSASCSLQQIINMHMQQIMHLSFGNKSAYCCISGVPMRSCCPLNLKKQEQKKEQKQEKWVYRHIKKNMHLKISFPNLCSHPNSLQNSL